MYGPGDWWAELLDPSGQSGLSKYRRTIRSVSSSNLEAKDQSINEQYTQKLTQAHTGKEKDSQMVTAVTPGDAAYSVFYTVI